MQRNKGKCQYGLQLFSKEVSARFRHGNYFQKQGSNDSNDWKTRRKLAARYGQTVSASFARRSTHVFRILVQAGLDELLELLRVISG